MSWLLLAGAILAEVTGTMSLRASEGFRRRRWIVGVVVGYLLAFVLLSTVLAGGMSLGVAYGIWSAGGVALTAVLGRLVFGEPLTATMGVGIALIAAGVLLVQLGSHDSL
ncbi:multidrug efflux SMR transporter [Blastococcus sp. CCUG 61487]|uniref:DMT family transporter n=1 Tax=Blastococcus sp. CCUG 61487 TaxID=1840703 RepID=UPI0010C0B065|nr:multidrug efflux SMR transporter [Blastococcus sp. CCUG 61487]TKJ28862.1 cation transporter [Blastococcus sp. CCUG 61487]